MMNYNQICKEVATDVKDMMVSAIEKGEDSLSYERYYGEGIVVVEIYQRCIGGWLTTFTDVVIAHSDCRHSSPLLRQAIESSLPDWDKEYDKIQELHQYDYQ